MLFATLQAMDTCLHLRILQDVGLKFELTPGFKSLGELGLDKSSSLSTVQIVHVGNHFMSVATNEQCQTNYNQASWNL